MPEVPKKPNDIMILDIENIKIGKSRLIRGKLVHRRGNDSYLVEGQTYDFTELITFFGIDKPEPDTVSIVGPNKQENAKPDIIKLGIAFVEPPSRILSYHICNDKDDLVLYKLAAIARKILLYYTSTHIRDGKYYADQPWMIDWDTIQGQSKEFIKSSSEQYKGDNVNCPFCSSSHSKLSAYVSHVITSHSYNKRIIKEGNKEDNIQDNTVQSDKNVGQEYKCPYCDKVLKSASGRTNHIKSNHPDKT